MIDLAFTYADLEYFLLILVRVTSFIFIAPFFGTNNTPSRAKVCIGVFTSFLIYGSITRPEVVYNTLTEYAILVMKEALAGFVIGFGAQICLTIVLFTGHMVDTEIGLGMAHVFDVNTRQNVTITGFLYQTMFTLILIISGMYRYLLQALVDTFRLIPVGHVQVRTDHLMQTFIRFMSDYLVIGFRICLPVFCAILLLNCVLGILAKIAPQMNMFAVGIQLKVLTGFAVLFFTAFLMPNAVEFVFREIKTMIVSFVEGMM